MLIYIEIENCCDGENRRSCHNIIALNGSEHKKKMASYNSSTRRKRVATDTTMTVTAVSLLCFIAISSSATTQCSAFVAPVQHNGDGVGKQRPLITQDTDNNKFVAQPNNNYSLEQNRQQSSTSPQMGIRSFIKKKILR